VNELDEIRQWALTAAAAAAGKKADETIVLEVSGVLAITEYFVITSAGNDRLVKAIVEEVERRIDEVGGPKPIRIEGLADAQWVLVDYGDFVVHVFLDEVRRYYDLERLWSDVPRIPFEEEGPVTSATSAVGGE
jgi:ribosome-associated protein